MLRVKKCLIFGQIYKFVFVVSKPLNRLWSVTPFYKWEAMLFHHIFLDLVSNFGKGLKRGLKKKLIFCQERVLWDPLKFDLKIWNLAWGYPNLNYWWNSFFLILCQEKCCKNYTVLLVLVTKEDLSVRQINLKKSSHPNIYVQGVPIFFTFWFSPWIFVLGLCIIPFWNPWH